jgi:hypothetical protein
MIKLNIANLIPRRLAIYLLGIIPGVLFHLSVAFGNPELAHKMGDRAKQVYPFQPYALFILFVFSCLLIGQTFFLLSWFADIFLSFLYQLKRYFVRITFASWWMYKWFAKLQGAHPNRNLFIRSLSGLIFRARIDKQASQRALVLRCWDETAKQLLKRRYGIDKGENHRLVMEHEWEVWYSVLGKPPVILQEAVMTMRTILGCGLAGLSALYVSPGLRNRYFITIAIVFTVSGCYQLFDLAKWQQDRVRVGLARLRSVLSELAETTSDVKKGADDSDKGFEMTIDTDDKKDD